ncbi:MAG: metalloprotease PmbA [Succinivibrio sp.]
MTEFKADLKKTEERLQEIASFAIEQAILNGADECEVSVGGEKGISVSSRDCEVENIEYHRNNGLDITVYKDKKKGNASSTDMSNEAIKESVLSAINIAGYSNSDDCSGLADKELLCRDIKDLDLIFENDFSTDKAAEFAISLERMALDRKLSFIKNSDGAGFCSSIHTSVLANSNGFNQAKSQSIVWSSLTLLGQSDGKMQRGFGYGIARAHSDLVSKESIVEEAIKKTRRKLGAKSLNTGKYNVIFSERAAVSLWSILSIAISGGSIYRKSSFLCDRLDTQIFPSYVTIHEDPFVKRELESRNYDLDGVQVKESNIVENGVLKEYLLGTYSSRKLKMQTNGHAGGLHNWFICFDKEHSLCFDDLLKSVGEGIVITDLMGQGTDLVSGNYSRGAEGYYFKNGKFVHSVEGITVAGNLKDMFMNMQAIADDIDNRSVIKTGSVFIPDMTVSGQ